jgi:hypothetical protein
MNDFITFHHIISSLLTKLLLPSLFAANQQCCLKIIEIEIAEKNTSTLFFHQFFLRFPCFFYSTCDNSYKMLKY